MPVVETPEYDRLIDQFNEFCSNLAAKWIELVQASSDNSQALAVANTTIEEYKESFSNIDAVMAAKLAPTLDKFKETFGMALAAQPPAE